MTWSRHSRRTEPISLSAYPFCQGERGDVGRSRMPIALPTIGFQILYCLVIVRHGRRLWVSFGVTANPTAEWISRQVTEAFPWDHAPRYLIRDRDTSYGPGSIRRECLDHMIV